jgi:hypothetical protein
MANEQSSGSEKYVTNPYFLHYFDHPRMVLVSKPLNRDNYSTCCRAMTPSLNIKSKRGFVDVPSKYHMRKTNQMTCIVDKMQ